MLPTSRHRRLAAGGAVTLLTLAAAVPALAASRVTERLSDGHIAGGASARAGTVTFTVRNVAGAEHELVVLRTSRRAARLPVRNGRASEAGKVGEVEVAGHRTRTLRLRLGKGHYALICNIPGHYQAGMRKDFTVR